MPPFLSTPVGILSLAPFLIILLFFHFSGSLALSCCLAPLQVSSGLMFTISYFWAHVIRSDSAKIFVVGLPVHFGSPSNQSAIFIFVVFRFTCFLCSMASIVLLTIFDWFHQSYLHIRVHQRARIGIAYGERPMVFSGPVSRDYRPSISLGEANGWGGLGDPRSPRCVTFNAFVEWTELA